MITGKQIGIGLGVVAAISIVYFGFTEKGKAKWAGIMGPKPTDPLAGKPKLTAESVDADIKLGADGAGSSVMPKRMPFPYGGTNPEFGGTSERKKRDKYNQKLYVLKQQGMTT